MTFEALYTLEDAFDEALKATCNAANRDVIRWLQIHKRNVLDDNRLTIESLGLNQMLRAFRKKREGSDVVSSKVESLCLDFGIPVLDLDDEISIPQDPENPLYGACDWIDLDNATVRQIDMHIELIDAQEAALHEKSANYRMLRQIVAQVVPGRTDIPLRELRAIAREKNGNAE